MPRYFLPMAHDIDRVKGRIQLFPFFEVKKPRHLLLSYTWLFQEPRQLIRVLPFPKLLTNLNCPDIHTWLCYLNSWHRIQAFLWVTNRQTSYVTTLGQTSATHAISSSALKSWKLQLWHFSFNCHFFLFFHHLLPKLLQQGSKPLSRSSSVIHRKSSVARSKTNNHRRIVSTSTEQQQQLITVCSSKFVIPK